MNESALVYSGKALAYLSTYGPTYLPRYMKNRVDIGMDGYAKPAVKPRDQTTTPLFRKERCLPTHPLFLTSAGPRSVLAWTHLHTQDTYIIPYHIYPMLTYLGTYLPSLPKRHRRILRVPCLRRHVGCVGRRVLCFLLFIYPVLLFFHMRV